MLNVKVQCSKWECLLCSRTFTSKFCFALHCKNVHKEENGQPLVEFDGRPFYEVNDKSEQHEKATVSREIDVQKDEKPLLQQTEEFIEKTERNELLVCAVCKKAFTNAARLVSHQRLHLSRKKLKISKKVAKKRGNFVSNDKTVPRSPGKKEDQDGCEVAEDGFQGQHFQEENLSSKDDHVYIVSGPDMDRQHTDIHRRLNMNIVIKLAEENNIENGKNDASETKGDQLHEVVLSSNTNVRTFPLSRKRGRPKNAASEDMVEDAGAEFEEQIIEQTLVFPEVPAEVRSGKRRSGARKKSRECDVCNKVFANRSSLREHLRMHTGEKPYICSICDKGFIRMGHLRQHMCSHTGLWPFKCGACGKGFMNPSRVTRHMRVHNDDRPCVCDKCGETFKEPHHLARHMHLHSGLKPFKCPICEDRYFIQAGNLKIHMKTHEREIADSKITIGDVSHEVSLTSTNQSTEEDGLSGAEENEAAIGELLVSSEVKCDTEAVSGQMLKDIAAKTRKSNIARSKEGQDLMPNVTREGERANEADDSAVESNADVVGEGTSDSAHSLIGSQIVLQIVPSVEQDFQVQGLQALSSLDPELLRQLATSVAQEMQSQS